MHTATAEDRARQARARLPELLDALEGVDLSDRDLVADALTIAGFEFAWVGQGHSPDCTYLDHTVDGRLTIGWGEDVADAAHVSVGQITIDDLTVRSL